VANPRPVLNPGSTQTIGAKISSDPNYSIYLAVVTKAGLLPKLTNPNSVWTVFAPDNDAFVRSGIPSAAVINAMPAQQVAAIGMYSIIPGQQYLTSNLGDSFPNVQLPTSLKIADVPGLPVPLEMSPSSLRMELVELCRWCTDQKFSRCHAHLTLGPPHLLFVAEAYTAIQIFLSLRLQLNTETREKQVCRK